MKPVAWNRLKESELVGITLVEILLVFIFAFLLVLNVFYRDNIRVRADVAEVPEVQKLVSQIHDRLDPEAPESTESSKGSIGAMVVIVEQLREIDAFLERLSETGVLREPDIWEPIKSSGGIVAVIEQLSDAESYARELADENDLLKHTLDDAGIPIPTQPLGGRGDKPGNCWYAEPIRRQGDQYIFRVTIHEDHLYVERAWPDSRAGDPALNELAELLIRVPGDVSREEFLSLTEDVFEYSKTQNCRYYVRVVDETQTKDAILSGLRAIEEHFYKYQENF